MTRPVEHPGPERVPPPDLTPAPPAPDEGLSLIALLNALLRRRRMIIALPTIGGLIAIPISLVLPHTYTAQTTFAPEESRDTDLPAGFAGLADQLGFSLGRERTKSPQFYAAVLRSRELREQVLQSKYADPRADAQPGDSATLLSLLRVDGEDGPDSLLKGLERLDDLLTIPVDQQTDIVAVRMQARYPTLAADVANRFLALLNEFNTERRQLQARQTRVFVERSLSDAETALRAAEDIHRTFLQRNRLWQQSPDLIATESRLQREVRLKQEIYLTLQREFESARIDEVNDTPAITVIDRAVPPRRRSHPRRKLIVIATCAFFGLIGITWAFIADYIERLRNAREPEFEKFLALWRGLVSDLRSLLPGRAARGTS